MARVLLVDDNQDILLLNEVVLKQGGHEISTADGGGRALAMIAEGLLPDLVVLDVQMADVDGWTVLERIRANPTTEHLRVILCTVKQSSRDLARGWELGCDGYIFKPFDIRELDRVVREVLARSTEDREAQRRYALEGAMAVVERDRRQD
jgi:DNA-binding response OmpR family regulator